MAKSTEVKMCGKGRERGGRRGLEDEVEGVTAAKAEKGRRDLGTTTGVLEIRETMERVSGKRERDAQAAQSRAQADSDSVSERSKTRPSRRSCRIRLRFARLESSPARRRQQYALRGVDCVDR